MWWDSVQYRQLGGSSTSFRCIGDFYHPVGSHFHVDSCQSIGEEFGAQPYPTPQSHHISVIASQEWSTPFYPRRLHRKYDPHRKKQGLERTQIWTTNDILSLHQCFRKSSKKFLLPFFLSLDFLSSSVPASQNRPRNCAGTRHRIKLRSFLDSGGHSLTTSSP